jgi:hypothetical protein
MTDTTQAHLPDEAKLQAALKKARQRAYRLHRALNVPVAVMKDGKVFNKIPSKADIEAGRIG